MSKDRVYQLAKRYEVSTKAMVEILSSLGFKVASNMSGVSDEMAAAVKNRFAAERARIRQEEEAKVRRKLAAQQAGRQPGAPTQPTRPPQPSHHPRPPRPPSRGQRPQYPPRGAHGRLRGSMPPRPDRRGAPGHVPPRPDRQGAPGHVQPRPDRQGAPGYRPQAVRDRRPVGEASLRPRPPQGRPGFPPRQTPERPAPPTRVKERDRRDRDRDKEREREAERDRSRGGKSRGGKSGAEPVRGAGVVSLDDLPEVTVRGMPIPMIDTTRRRGRKRKKRPTVVDAREVRSTVRATLAKMDAGVQRKRYRRERTEAAEPGVERKVIRVAEFLSVAELAEQLQKRPVELIADCMKLGLMVTINQRLDMETIEMVAAEYGYEVEAAETYEVPEEEEEAAVEEALTPRHPVVTVMGHVDHGKTSLLDYIRRTSVVSGESGGITQHIGAYEVEHEGRRITFIDTPGHEAFTAMRARGAQVTDIVVLVVAADSGVMPQTVEAIDHARAAGVPILVAVNKCDLPTAQLENVKQQLTAYNLVAEDWGGKTIMVPVSARTGMGIDTLLEMILLQADVMDLKAKPDVRAHGVIIEAQLDRGRGPVATVLVQSGTLRVGDPFVTGTYYGKVRAMFNEHGELVGAVGPSAPVQVLGAGGVPQAGDSFTVVESEAEAHELSQRRQRIRREQEVRVVRRVRLDDVYGRIKEGHVRELSIVVKGDVDGSVEAVADALERLSTGEVRVNVVHKGVGAITESDVLLAAASDAVIIGFHVRPDMRAREVAAREKVDVRFFRVIYEAVDAVRQALAGLLAPEEHEEVIGHAQVRQTFRVPKVGVIAGCYVTDGRIVRAKRVRVIRDGVEVFDGGASSLRRFKDDVREVEEGYECGVGLEGFGDVKDGDVLEFYEVVKTARTL